MLGQVGGQQSEFLSHPFVVLDNLAAGVADSCVFEMVGDFLLEALLGRKGVAVAGIKADHILLGVDPLVLLVFVEATGVEVDEVVQRQAGNLVQGKAAQANNGCEDEHEAALPCLAPDFVGLSPFGFEHPIGNEGSDPNGGSEHHMDPATRIALNQEQDALVRHGHGDAGNAVGDLFVNELQHRQQEADYAGAEAAKNHQDIASWQGVHFHNYGCHNGQAEAD